jgi:hypothetical protein
MLLELYRIFLALEISDVENSFSCIFVVFDSGLLFVVQSRVMRKKFFGQYAGGGEEGFLAFF